jgi:hypothetical protein
MPGSTKSGGSGRNARGLRPVNQNMAKISADRVLSIAQAEMQKFLMDLEGFRLLYQFFHEVNDAIDSFSVT